MPNFLSLKYKFFAFFLAVAVIPLCITVVVTFQKAREAVVDRIVSKLETIADLQQRRINELYDEYLKQTLSVTSNKELREGIVSFVQARSISGSNLSVIQSGLTEQLSVLQPTLRSGAEVISVLDLNGRVIASTKSSLVGMDHSSYGAMRVATKTHLVHSMILDETGVPRMLSAGPLVLDGKTLVVIEILFQTDALVDALQDYTGLGQTGDILLTQRNRTGDALIINPLRFDSFAAFQRTVSRSDIANPINNALIGEESIFSGKNTFDYRGARIFAVTRSIPQLGWGIVVQLDQIEALAPIMDLLHTFWTIIFLTTLLVIIVAFWVARLVYTPITELTEATQKLQQGDFHYRAKVHSGDEIGLLAQTFNHMADKLRDVYSTLETRVRERTKQLAESQSRLETVFATMPVGVVLVRGPHGTAVMINKYGEYLLGRKIDPATGREHGQSAYPVLTEDEQPYPKNQLPINIALEQGIIVSKDDMIVRRADGTRCYMRITAGPIKDLSGKVTAAVAVYEDITQLKEIDRAKTEFVSIASHQLRTPLTSINWYTEMLLAGDAGDISDDQKDYLGEIATGNKRMLDLVNALLNVSRLELGTFIVEPEPTDIVQLAQSVVDEEKPFIQEKHLALLTPFQSDIPLIDLDPKLVRMVLQNLLSNAVKYTPDNGKIEFGISLDDEKDNVVIRLSDNGLGIPKDEQNHIFSKLFRANNVKVTSADGTGLGLYIVKSIVDHTNGRIRFESAENNGTTFYVTFPLKGMKKRVGEKPLS